MDWKNFLRFAAKFTIAHVVTYFIVGAIAYQTLTRQFYEGAQPLFATFMRTPVEPALWQHVIRWLIAGQVLRGVLIALALMPFYQLMCSWSWRKRTVVIAGLYLVLGFWAATVAAPGTIDGMIFLRPEISGYAHLIVQVEIIAQGLLLAAWVAWWMPRRKQASRQFVSGNE